VQNKLTDENTKLAVELNFKHMDDFSPARVAEQVQPLKELLDMRGGRTLFRYRHNDELVGLSARRLNDYIGEHMGEGFTAKDLWTHCIAVGVTGLSCGVGAVETATSCDSIFWMFGGTCGCVQLVAS